jgi:hypothetical protein
MNKNLEEDWGVKKGWQINISLELISKKRAYFGVSETSLEIYDERRHVSFPDKVLNQIT